MRKFVLFIVSCFLFPTLAVASLSDADRALEKGDYKNAITQYQQLIQQADSSHKPPLQIKLAVAQFRDQEQERAFRTFLDAVDAVPSQAPATPSQAEEILYKEALKVYLDHPGRSAQEAAAKIRQDYMAAVALHPDYYLINYLVALSLANQGLFDDFFASFYNSYTRYPDHFLAYKTKALLHLKLMERGRTPEERNKERQAVKELVAQALKRNPADTGLQQMAINFADPAQKKEVVQTRLNNIMSDNIIIPRGELLFFVKAALDTDQAALAQQFVDKARTWYPQSQAIDAAQEFIGNRGRG